MSAPPQQVSMTALTRDGDRPCLMTFTTEPPWTVEISGLNSVLARAVGSDPFDALAQLRTALEPTGVALLCQGACRNVWPSPMQRQSGSTSAYLLELGRPATEANRVNIFDPANRACIGSVAEQESFARAWMASLRAR